MKISDKAVKNPKICTSLVFLTLFEKLCVLENISVLAGCIVHCLSIHAQQDSLSKKSRRNDVPNNTFK